MTKSKLLLMLAIAGSFLLAPIASTPAQQASAVNRDVVELETTGADGISVRIAEDLSRLVDDGATRSVLPVVGRGSLQNIIDMEYLHGVDLAIVQADVLDYVKRQKIISYITKLYNEEFHLLARPEIKTVGDLANQNVNVDLLGTGTDIMAARLFDRLKLHVNATRDSQPVALEKLRKGDIAAIAFVAGKPSTCLPT